MSDTLRFNIKLNIDGKDVVVKASESIKELQKNIASTRTETQKATASFINFNQHITQLQNLSGVVSQFASTLNSITAESRSFSAAMASANTMAGKSGEDFTKLKGEVADLAKTVPVARDALANGLYQVVSNGVPENNWVSFLDKSARSSVGGIADLGEVVKVTSTMIKNYGLSWDKAGAIQDKIQLTAKNGVTSFEQLAQALPRVGANAATLGVSIDELMATFATLTGVSGNTAEVSTQLAAVFTALIKPSTEAQKTAELLGIKFDAASVKAAGGLQNFLKELNKAVQDYSSKTGILSQEIYGKLFGSAESLRALTPLMGELSSKFDDNIEAMKGSAGTMDEAFDTMANTGASKMQLLKNKLAEIGDTITNAISPALPYLNMTAQIGLSLSAVSQLVTTLGKLRASMASLAVVQTLVKTSTAGLAGTFSVLHAAFTGTTIGATSLKFAIRGLLIATGVGAAITALGIALDYFLNSSEKVSNQTKELSGSLSAARSESEKTSESLENGYNSSLTNLQSTYTKLQAEWKSLSTEHQKREWIDKNKSSFDSLGLSVNSLTDAENVLVNNTDKVVKALQARAKAMAAEDTLKDLYSRQDKLIQQQKDLNKQTTNNVHNATKAGTRVYDRSYINDKNIRNGYIVRKQDKYAAQYGGSSGVYYEFTKKGEQHFGSQSYVSRGSQGRQISDSLNQVQKDIKSTAASLTSALKEQQQLSKATTNSKSSISGTSNHLDLSGSGSKSKNKNKKTVQLGDQLRTDPVSEEDFENNYKFYDKKISQYKGKNKELIASWKELRDAAKETFEQMKFERENGGLKMKFDVNAIPKIDVHETGPGLLNELQQDLERAQGKVGSALTVDAMVKAQAKVADIQEQINKLTNGELTIPAEVEPTKIEKGSAEDKLQSYQNAQTKAGKVQQMLELKIIGADEAKRIIDQINEKLKTLGIEPIKIDLDTADMDKKMESIRESLGGNITQSIQEWKALGDAFKDGGDAATGAGGALVLVGQQLQQVAGDGAAAKVGAIMAAIGQLVLGFATATAQASELGPFGWIGFAIAGAATLASIIAQVSSFSTGGIVGGTSYHGDKVPAKVNSGEMILTMKQQKRLFDIANGNIMPRMALPSYQSISPSLNTGSSLTAIPLDITIHGKTRGTDTLYTIQNVRRQSSKFGKRWD